MNEDLKKLYPLVTRPEWDMFLVYITNLNSEAHRELEVCTENGLKPIQAKISVYKDLLTLKQTISTIINVR